MGLHKLEYKRLLNELRFKNEELEIIEESILDIHLEFEKYYADFLNENNISKQELEDNKSEFFKAFQKKLEDMQKPPETDETGLVVVQQLSDEDKEAKKDFSKLYKEIVKKCHPDKLSMDDMEHFNKMNTKFKAATWGYNNAKWSILIKVAEELGIAPTSFKQINAHLRREIESTELKIKKHKSTFSWKLFSSKGKEKKDSVIKEFIYQIFRRKL